MPSSVFSSFPYVTRTSSGSDFARGQRYTRRSKLRSPIYGSLLSSLCQRPRFASPFCCSFFISTLFYLFFLLSFPSPPPPPPPPPPPAPSSPLHLVGCYCSCCCYARFLFSSSTPFRNGDAGFPLRVQSEPPGRTNEGTNERSDLFPSADELCCIMDAEQTKKDTNAEWMCISRVYYLLEAEEFARLDIRKYK